MITPYNQLILCKSIMNKSMRIRKTVVRIVMSDLPDQRTYVYHGRLNALIQKQYENQV